MDWKAKTGIIGAVAVVLFALFFIIKYQVDTINRLKAIETTVVQSKDLGEGLVRAQASYMTRKDLDRLIVENDINLDNIKDDLKTLRADVKAFNTIKVVSTGYSGDNIPTTSTTPREDYSDNPDSDEEIIFSEYLKATQWLGLTESFSDGTTVPLGKTGFSAWRKNPWSLELHPREYNAMTVLAQDEDGRHYAYSKFQIKVDGEVYTLPIEAEITEKYPNPKFRFDPKMYLSVDGGFVTGTSSIHGEVTPNIGVSLFSYGKTRKEPIWSFATIGGGYATQSKKPAVVFSPVNYNLGNVLPLITNFHVGPAVSLDPKGNVGLYIGGRVGL